MVCVETSWYVRELGSDARLYKEQKERYVRVQMPALNHSDFNLAGVESTRLIRAVLGTPHLRKMKYRLIPPIQSTFVPFCSARI